MFYAKLNLSNDAELESLYKNYDEAKQSLINYLNRESIEISSGFKKEPSAATDNSEN